MKQEVIPTDIYQDGDLIGIEFNNLEGEFVLVAEWDPTDEQTNENRVAFRRWSYHMLKQIGYEVLK